MIIVDNSTIIVYCVVSECRVCHGDSTIIVDSTTPNCGVVGECRVGHSHITIINDSGTSFLCYCSVDGQVLNECCYSAVYVEYSVSFFSVDYCTGLALPSDGHVLVNGYSSVVCSIVDSVCNVNCPTAGDGFCCASNAEFRPTGTVPSVALPIPSVVSSLIINIYNTRICKNS